MTKGNCQREGKNIKQLLPRAHIVGVNVFPLATFYFMGSCFVI